MQLPVRVFEVDLGYLPRAIVKSPFSSKVDGPSVSCRVEIKFRPDAGTEGSVPLLSRPEHVRGVL